MFTFEILTVLSLVTLLIKNESKGNLHKKQFID